MPLNGRWDLIRRLKVKGFKCNSSLNGRDFYKPRHKFRIFVKGKDKGKGKGKGKVHPRTDHEGPEGE